MNEKRIVKIPSLEDWNPKALGEDALTAFERFSGKSNDQMQKYFFANVVSAINDIQFMPEIPFQYYLFGLCQYLRGENLNQYEACAAASGFLHLIHEKIERDFPVIEPLVDELRPLMAHVAQHQESYGATRDIYGDFEDLHQKIMEKLKKIDEQMG